MKDCQITVKAARVNRGYSQKQAAKKLKVNQSTLSNWERGKSSPNVDKLNLMEEVYGLPIDKIFFGTAYALSLKKLRLEGNSGIKSQVMKEGG